MGQLLSTGEVHRGELGLTGPTGHVRRCLEGWAERHPRRPRQLDSAWRACGKSGKIRAGDVMTALNDVRDAHSGELKRQLVDIAPAPGFSGFDGSNNRVMHRVKVPGCMFVLRAVATPDMTASEAQAQMDPVITCLEALFATGAARFD